MPLPHDFRAAARLPIPVNANGAPLQVSGSKLQENFEYLDRKEVEIPEAGETIYHDWKVTASTESPGSWDVAGGYIYSQGDLIGVDDTNVAGSAGYVLLKITRDTDSREVIDAAVEFGADVPTSGSTYQYRALAYVIADDPVTQYQFEEIRIFEDLAVVNGEFQLVGLEMSHRNYYTPPA
jgi:hypothetical protein